MSHQVLQIRGGIEDNSNIVFLFLTENIHCDPSLELPQRDGSNEGHNVCFNGKIRKIFLKLSLLPLLIWSSAHVHIPDIVFNR